MSGAFKTLKASDVHTLPYTANKLWQVTTASYSSLGIKMFVGQNITSSVFYSSSDAKTTDSASGATQYRRLVYNSIKQLYYSNYLSSSYQLYSSSADNFEQTTINYQKTLYPLGVYQQWYNGAIKFFPTASDSIIRVLSIPQDIFGSKIVPGTFNITSSGYNINDDKEGNLFDNNQTLVGNIIYPHGLAIITNPNYMILFPTASNDNITVASGQKSGSFTLSFKGEHIIYENEVRCNLTEDEYNYTLNPSISSDGTGSLYGFVSSSVFNPYVTTIGLYNEAGELLVVSKLGKPVQIPRNSDISFIVRWDS